MTTKGRIAYDRRCSSKSLELFDVVRNPATLAPNHSMAQIGAVSMLACCKQRLRSADLASDTEEEEERELGDYTAKTGVGPRFEAVRVEGSGLQLLICKAKGR